jgi:energy-coupling factor transport system permease protein
MSIGDNGYCATADRARGNDRDDGNGHADKAGDAAFYSPAKAQADGSADGFDAGPDAELAADPADGLADVVIVSAQDDRVDPIKMSSPSWFIARINPVSRIIGALLLCLPMFISLDVVSACTALAIEFVLLWIGGVAPWTVCRKTWPVWIAATGSFISVFLYGRVSGEILWSAGWIVISEGSFYLAIATAIRVAAIAVPGVILALGLDPTDLADGLVEILHCPARFVYGGLAGLRMFTLLQDDWRALGLSQRSRGLGDGNAVSRALSQAFGLLVLSIRRATKLATAMEARGFGSSAPRSQARISRLGAIDWLFYAICLAIPLIALSIAIGTGNWHFAFQGA